jgi:hypothetical protein
MLFVPTSIHVAAAANVASSADKSREKTRRSLAAPPASNVQSRLGNREAQSPRVRPDCLRCEERDVAPLAAGEVLVKTLLLSLGPTSLN